MTLLRTSARSLAEDAAPDCRQYVEDLKSAYYFAYRQQPSRAEINSWHVSLHELARLLVSAGLADVEMLVEYPLPMCSLRADVVLAGVHPRTGEPAYVVVELKQWSAAQAIRGSEDLCEVRGTVPRRAQMHPVAQVRRYCEYLVDLTRVLDGHGHRVSGAAFLHNAEDRDVSSLLSAPVADGRLFTNTSRNAFLTFLHERLIPDPDHLAADALLTSRCAPTLTLLEAAADEVLHRRHFTLLGEQQKAFSLVLRTLAEVDREGNGRKEIVLVNGGPGSGKSVIALSLLGELSRRGRSVAHATGSKSFTTTLQRKVTEERSGTGKLFTYFNSFERARGNDLDVLILDEAHRLRETSNGAPPGSKWATKRQIDELIEAARVPVFLLDEHQVVRPGETGTAEAIEKAAAERGIIVRHVDLDAQFRCGGSRAYEAWVLQLLGLAPGGPHTWRGDDNFEVQVADSPAQLENFLRARRDEGHSARITAGFCWPWSRPNKDGTLVDDVSIGPWRRPWNISAPHGVGGLPPSDLWATDPAGFGQIGCIYTAQGFEYAWNGVILGPDLVWRGQNWRSDRSESRDTALNGASDADFDRLIKNTYKVLLTRGMAGTVLYSPDPETRAKLNELVRGGRGHDPS
ncbi:DNA/RNA helicase domain-containing protein [Streptomyces sp. RGM 3693]|uniref:DNA/RNA helicase domain-containing protein n=1 Tax=Streptomyces sp. RGM 3693 TaxID=3413284 RepID=UPI003D2B51B2